MRFWRKALLNALIFIATAGFFPSMIHIENVLVALLVAVLFCLFNDYVKPIVVMYVMPLVLITFGLIIPILNACVLQILSCLLKPWFYISNFGGAIGTALIMTFVSSVAFWHFRK